MAGRNSASAVDCALCLCDYEDPRVLPICGHSFCLKCIKKSAKSNSLEVECPLCRKRSSVTSGGFEGLPINYALISLLLNLSPESNKGTIGTEFNSVLCSKHKGEEMIIACIDCWTPLCMRCYEEAHRKHRMSSVGKFVADTITKFQSYSKDLNIKLTQVESLKDKLEGNKAEFLNEITEQELAINEEYASLKILIERERSKLVEELMTVKESVLKNIEKRIQEFEVQSQELRSLNTRIQEMTKVNGAEINMSAIAQLKEIKERLDDATNTKIEFEGPKSVVKFLPTGFQDSIKNSSTSEHLNIIGRLQLNPVYRKNRDQWCEEEPFDFVQFTIPPMYFTSQHDTEEKLKKFTNGEAFVVNPDKSVTLIPDSYVDGLKIVKLICESKQETELQITAQSGLAMPKTTAATVGKEALQNGPEHKDASDRPLKRNHRLFKMLRWTPQTNPS